MPIAILYGILILISYYWLDKLRIIRKSSINGSINNHLSVKLYYYTTFLLKIEMTEMLEFILPIFSISNLFFFYHILGVVSYTSMIGFFIGVIHAILPMQKINIWLFKIAKRVPNDGDYN